MADDTYFLLFCFVRSIFRARSLWRASFFFSSSSSFLLLLAFGLERAGRELLVEILRRDVELELSTRFCLVGLVLTEEDLLREDGILDGLGETREPV